MVNRPAGGPRSTTYDRSPDNWYVEPDWAVRQLMTAVDFGDDMIWDGCCGKGTVLNVAAERGHMVLGSDIVDRGARHRFIRGNVLNTRAAPKPEGRRVSYISNPPYGADDIAERIMRHVLTFDIHRAAFILPIAFLAGIDRHQFFTRDIRPSHTGIYSRRPTMPPGHLIAEMGDRAFKGGMADYCAIIYTAPHRFRTETIWFDPTIS